MHCVTLVSSQYLTCFTANVDVVSQVTHSLAPSLMLGADLDVQLFTVLLPHGVVPLFAADPDDTQRILRDCTGL